MHFSPLFVTLAAATLGGAVSLNDLPDCATTPLENGIGATSCSITNFGCICAASGFVSTVIPQIKTGCNAADYATTIQVAQGLCSQAGVTLNIPSTGGSSSAAAAPAKFEAPTASTPASSVASSNVSPTVSMGATFMLPLGEVVVPTASTSAGAGSEKDATFTLALGPVVLPASSRFKKKKEMPLTSSSMGGSILPVSPSSTPTSAGAGSSLLVSTTTLPTSIVIPPSSISGSLASSPARSTTTETTTVTSTLTSLITHLAASSTSTSTFTLPTMMPTMTAPYSTSNGSAMANTTNATAMAFEGAAASGHGMGTATMAIVAALIAGTYFLEV